MTTRPITAALLGCALLASGCARLHFPFWPRGDGLGRGFTQEDLSAELSAFAVRFAAQVDNAAGDISDATRDRRIRRNALLWRLRAIPLVQQVAFNTNPQEAYLYTLTLAEMMQQYLSDGDGRALFGPQQPIAIDTATRLRDDALEIGGRFLTRAQLQRVSAEVDKLAAQYPMLGREFSFQNPIAAVEQVRSSDVFSLVMGIPLSPFRALEGVDSGAAAIRNFNQTARRFSDIVDGLPEQLRGQLELLLYDIEDRETVVQGLAAFEEVAASANRASEAVDRLPQTLRTALADSQGALGQAAATVGQAQALMEPLTAVATQLREASADWRGVLGDRSQREAGPDDRPFDIREWQTTAAQVGSTAAELRGLANEINTLAASPNLDAAIDHLFWRAVALLVVLFALLLGYRLLAARLVRRPPA